VIKELRPGDPVAVGPYRLLGRLGTGGMGQVYLAKSPGGRLVAIKVIRPEMAEERGFRARFAREVAAARTVSGMFTAAVVDADPTGEMPWLATAYVAGPSLTDAVEEDGPLPVETVLGLAAGLAEGLQAIHAAGLVHRDLKPSNVLLAADGPRVIDFGISRAREGSMLTQTGTVMGSPGFLSPEQARGRRVIGTASDVFSLGAVLTFAATGDSPFGGGPTPALMYRVVHEPPDLANVPAELLPLLEWCLSKDPNDRPTTSQILDQLTAGAGVLDDEWLPGRVSATLSRYVPTTPGTSLGQTASWPQPPEPAPAELAVPHLSPADLSAADLLAAEPGASTPAGPESAPEPQSAPESRLASEPELALEPAASPEPEASEPEAAEPAASADGETAAPEAIPAEAAAELPLAGPVSGKPVSGKPAPGKPVSGKPARGKPARGKPAPADPVPAARVSGKPVAGEPVSAETAAPEAAPAEAAPAEAAAPETAAEEPLAEPGLAAAATEAPVPDDTVTTPAPLGGLAVAATGVTHDLAASSGMTALVAPDAAGAADMQTQDLPIPGSILVAPGQGTYGAEGVGTADGGQTFAIPVTGTGGAGSTGAVPGAPVGPGGPGGPGGSVVPLQRPRRRRWPLATAAAAAIIIVAVVVTVLALLPSGPNKPVVGPSPSLLTAPTTRPAPTPTPDPTPSPTHAPTHRPTTPATKQKHTSPPATHTSRPPVASTTAVTSTPPQQTNPTTQPPSTHPAPKPTHTTAPPSGPQTISSASGVKGIGCSSYGSVGSGSGGSPVSFTFTNNSAADIQVWYLASGGSGDLEGTVAPGQSFAPAVDTKQDWMVANSGGGCIGLFGIVGSGEIVAS